MRVCLPDVDVSAQCEAMLALAGAWVAPLGSSLNATQLWRSRTKRPVLDRLLLDLVSVKACADDQLRPPAFLPS